MAWFDRLLGLNIKGKIQVAKNALYTSDKSIQEMIFVISEVIEEQIVKESKRSGHFELCWMKRVIVLLLSK